VTKAVGWAIDDLGPAPAEYALIALGSLARREQTLVTDQDHALVIEDGAGDHPWFGKFGEHVTATLETVGLKRCPGDVMISSPEWRDERRNWRKRWAAFVSKPEPEHILASNIVLDVRLIAGHEPLVEPFETMIDLARKSPTFVLFLANSARDRPPLGPFSRWRLERRGPHAGAFDIKKGAILPIVQIARVLGLVAGSASIETVARLYDAAEAGMISVDSADILANGYELVTSVRLTEQSTRWRTGRELDNWVRPVDLTAWQRAGLREVLKTIRISQDAISLSYQGAYVP
jgi:CBS domain-containing protein